MTKRLEIKKRWSDKVMFWTKKKTTFRAFVEIKRANLYGANLNKIKNYTDSHAIGIELCKRSHDKFTGKEKEFIP